MHVVGWSVLWISVGDSTFSDVRIVYNCVMSRFRSGTIV